MDVINYGGFNKPPYMLQQWVGTDVQKLMALGDPQLDELELAAHSVLSAFNIDTAAMPELEIIGRHLNIAPGERSVDNFRVLLKLKAMLNRSAGTGEQLITIVKAVFQATEVQLVVKDFAEGLGLGYSVFGVEITHNGTAGLYAEFGLAFDDADWYFGSDEALGSSEDTTTQAIFETVTAAGIPLTLIAV